MEEERIIDYQKRFSNLHIILSVIVGILIMEHNVYGRKSEYDYSPLIAILIIICSECFLSKVKFFKSRKLIITFRYVEVLVTSVFITFNAMKYINVLGYAIFLLVAVEFIINFDINDRYYQYLSLSFVIVPMFFMQIYNAIRFNNDNTLIEGLMCVVMVFLLLLYIGRFYIDVTDRLQSKYLAQLRYIEDANAVNQQLIENQLKVKKANEQLAYQKVQLEFAYKKINNVNTEILLQNQILKLISAHHDVDRLMSLIVATIRSQMSVDTFAIILLPDAITSKSLMYQVRTTYGSKYQQFLGEKIEAGNFDRFIHMNKTYVDNHVDSVNYEFVKNSEVASLIIIPLIKGVDIIGGLYIADSKYDAFIDNVPFFEATVSSINIAIENSNLYARLEEMAIKDELTGLYNRRYLNKVCDQYIFEALREKTPLSCALFDIDKFKNFNDSYGHLFGDEALRMVAHMAIDLAEKVGGIAGRYGGEEFVVLFPNRNLDATYKEVKLFHDNIRETKLNHGDEQVGIRVSVGISSFPETCLNPNDLLNYSDWAMYYSKQNGRDKITIDSAEIREQVRLK